LLELPYGTLWVTFALSSREPKKGPIFIKVLFFVARSGNSKRRRPKIPAGGKCFPEMEVVCRKLDKNITRAKFC
jgi:hypothetical protein